MALIAFKYYLRYKRYTGYYWAYEKFNNGFADIHSISNVDIDYEKKEEVDTSLLDRLLIRNFLTQIKLAFDDITQTKTSACIKLLGFDNEKQKYFLYTLERDNHADNRAKEDLGDDNDNIRHWLSENTCFNSLFKVKEDKSLVLNRPYFIKRRMQYSWSYKNSRVTHKIYSRKSKICQFLTKWKFSKWLYIMLSWPLEYRSAILVPVIPYKVERFGNAKYDNERYSKVIPNALLCIDSTSSRGCKQMDVEIMKGLADGIYNDLYNVIIGKEK